MPPPVELLQGIKEFNRGAFFQQHETLEDLWIQEPDAVRYLYQGILLIGVGFYHWSRGNWHGAVTKLEQGMAKLEPYRPSCMTVDVDRLLAETRPLCTRLRYLGAGQLDPFPPPDLPHIHLTPA